MYHQIDDVTLNSEVPRLKQRVAELEAELNKPRSDEEVGYGHIIKFWEEHTAPGNPHHSIHEYIEWLWSMKEEVERLRGELTLNGHLLDSAVSGIKRHKQALEEAKVALELSVQTIHGIEANNAQHEALATIKQVLGE